MAGAAGPNTAETGLVFAYDTGNTVTSYIGEPTTNIAYAVNNNLNSGGNWWVNGGNATFNDNDTSIPKPSIPNVNTSNLYVFSSLVTGTGSNQQLGSSIITINPSTTYSFSIWYYFTGTSMQVYPYVRTAVNNDLLAYFAYNGDTNGANWPKNQWLLLKATVTTQANENGIYMSSYTGTSLNDKVYYFGYQVEQKAHCTPLVLGTRSGTQGLLPLVNNSTIDISNVSFDSNAQIVFDGSNDTISVNSYPAIELVDNVSVEYVYKRLSTNPILDVIANKYHSTGWELFCTTANTFALAGRNGDGTYYSTSNAAYTMQNNQYYHLVAIKEGLSWRLYVNGELYSYLTANTVGTWSNNGILQIGGEGNGYYPNMELPILKIYNQVLTALEIQQNFQASRYRFGI